MDWTKAARGIEQLLELIDDGYENNVLNHDFAGVRAAFRLHRIVIRPTNSDPRTGVIIAYDKDGKMFPLVIFITEGGQLIADGF